MCRFLLVKSNKPIKPQKLLEEFVDMTEKSRAPDGDRQIDGFGIAYQIKNEKLKMKNYKWKSYKSLKPIWECRDEFSNFPKTKYFAVHVRAASYPQNRGNIEFNQPYTSGNLCFVFNGNLKGVKLNRVVPGQIGAQKLFSIIQKELEKNTPEDALRMIKKLMLDNAKKIIGLNIGLIVNNNIYALCEYGESPEYFILRYYKDRDISLICSESIGLYKWSKMKKEEIIKL